MGVLPLWTIRASVTPGCPKCGSGMTPVPRDWYACSSTVCDYEISASAYAMYGELGSLFEKDPDRFFAMVTSHRDEMRALEPVWLR